MRLKGMLITLVVLVGAVFAVSNWQTIFTNLPINLLFFTVSLPLGFMLLAAAVGLSAVFFLVSLIDRAGQLRQITVLERRIDTLQVKLEKRRVEEVGSLEAVLEKRVGELERQLESGMEHLEETLRESLAAFEMRSKERLQELEERVLLVRNELAADVAQVEDALRREVAGEQLEPR